MRNETAYAEHLRRKRNARQQMADDITMARRELQELGVNERKLVVYHCDFQRNLFVLFRLHIAFYLSIFQGDPALWYQFLQQNVCSQLYSCRCCYAGVLLFSMG